MRVMRIFCDCGVLPPIFYYESYHMNRKVERVIHYILGLKFFFFIKLNRTCSNLTVHCKVTLGGKIMRKKYPRQHVKNSLNFKMSLLSCIYCRQAEPDPQVVWYC